MKKKYFLIASLSLILLSILFIILYLSINNNNNNNNNNVDFLETKLEEFKPEDFYAKDEFALIALLSNYSNKKKLEKSFSSGDHRYYIFNKIINNIDSDILSNDDKNFIDCIEKTLKGDKIDKDFYIKNIKDTFLKGVCIGSKDKVDDEDLSITKSNYLNIIKSKQKKDNNNCNSIISTEDDPLNYDYFLCMTIAYNDFEKIYRLMSLYAYSNFEQSRCSSLMNENDFLYNFCKNNPKIWEYRQIDKK